MLIIGILFIGGFSRSVQFTAVQSLAYADMPTERISHATSFSAMTQQLTQSLGVGLAAIVVHLSLVWHDRPTPLPDDIAPAYFTLALASLASAVVFWLLPTHAGAALNEGQR